ncbi:uncharacterized protein M421DRAFT_60386 [Didymella exigua CBS 183.55]|uniref:Uncharacterized protein n=1 Tax=Didymella exigua CBS 183.55 TaxID=1150837 RepID=A0A6A5RQ95_9PLEO|nr:uncharacterized protein M421DRAFT_60386 [Didymella exigua CBS 183.55]KAF1929603.1 hypothetical protein M421DRAFT_60386 [Didymella exigua CBS 183.55]
MFKDETAVVAKKAEKRYEALAQQNSIPSPERPSCASSSQASPDIWTNTDVQLTISPASSISRYPTPESMTREMTPSIEDQAMGFFISNHVSQPGLVPRGQYEWLLEAMSQPGCEEMLRSSANAACLAGLANSTKNPQFESNTARRMFHQFYGITMLCSLESGEAIPDGMRELYEYCNPTSDYAVQGRQWTTRMTLFMQDSIDLNRDKDSDSVTMVSKAVNLDRELDSIKALMPKIWQHDTVCLEKPSEYGFGSFYHIYTDSWIAQMWNNLRLCRMHLYRIMRKHIWKGRACNPPLFTKEEVAPQMAAAEKVMRTTTAAICASVPQLTGMIAFPDWPPRKPSGSFAGLHSAVLAEDIRYRIHPPGTFLDPGRPTCIYHLVWPLYAAGSSDLSSSEMRQYAIDMLYFVGSRIGTRQAVVLAEALKEMQGGGPQSSLPEPVPNVSFGT